MSEVSFWDLLSNNVVTPYSSGRSRCSRSGTRWRKIPQRLAVICIIGGAALAITGARLLLFSIVLFWQRPISSRRPATISTKPPLTSQRYFM